MWRMTTKLDIPGRISNLIEHSLKLNLQATSKVDLNIELLIKLWDLSFDSGEQILSILLENYLKFNCTLLRSNLKTFNFNFGWHLLIYGGNLKFLTNTYRIIWILEIDKYFFSDIVTLWLGDDSSFERFSTIKKFNTPI